MSSINESSPFISYNLSVEERAAGYSLSPEQTLVLRNDIAEAAHQKLVLKYDPTNPQEFLQKEAELQGRILILQYIISRSESATFDLTSEILAVDEYSSTDIDDI